MMTSHQEITAEDKSSPVSSAHITNAAIGDACNQSQSTDGDLTSSIFASNLVIFDPVLSQYAADEEIVVYYRLENGFRCRTRDFVALYPLGWSDPRNFVAFRWAPKRAQAGTVTNLRHVRFAAADMQDKLKDNIDYYQFVYVTKKKEIAGASSRFMLTRPRPPPARDALSSGSEGEEADTQFIRIDSPLLASGESLATEQQPAKDRDTFEMVTRQISSPAMVLGASQSFTSHTEDLGALIFDLKQLEEDIVKIALKTNTSYGVDLSQLPIDASGSGANSACAVEEDVKQMEETVSRTLPVTQATSNPDVITTVATPMCEMFNRHALYSEVAKNKKPIVTNKENVPPTSSKTWAEALRDGCANIKRTITSPTNTPGTTTVTLATTPTDGMLISSTCTKTTVAALDCRPGMQQPVQEPEPQSRASMHVTVQNEPLDLSHSTLCATSFWKNTPLQCAEGNDDTNFCDGDTDHQVQCSDVTSAQTESVGEKSESFTAVDASFDVKVSSVDVDIPAETNFTELPACHLSVINDTCDVVVTSGVTSASRVTKSKLNCKECRKKIASMRSLRSKRAQAERNLDRLRAEVAELESIVSVKELLTRELSNQVKNLVQENGHLATINEKLFSETQAMPTPFCREVQDAEVTCKIEEMQLERRNVRNKMADVTDSYSDRRDGYCQKINSEIRELRRRNQQLSQEQDDIMYTLSLQGYTTMKTASGIDVDLTAKHGRVVELQGWFPNTSIDPEEEHHKKTTRQGNSVANLHNEYDILRSMIEETGHKVVDMQSNVRKVVCALADLRRHMCKLTGRVTQLETRHDETSRGELRELVPKMRRQANNCHGVLCDHVRNLRAAVESSQTAGIQKQQNACRCGMNRNVTSDNQTFAGDSYLYDGDNLTDVSMSAVSSAKVPKKRHSSEVRPSSKVVRAEEEEEENVRPLSSGSRPRSEYSQRQLEQIHAVKDALKQAQQQTTCVIAQPADRSIMTTQTMINPSGVTTAAGNCSLRQQTCSGKCCCAANSTSPGDYTECSPSLMPSSPFSWQMLADVVSCGTAPVRPTAAVNPSPGIGANSSTSSCSSSAVRSMSGVKSRKLCKKSTTSGLITRRRGGTSESRAMADPAVPPECPQCHARFRYNLSIDQFLMHMKQHQPMS